MFIANPLKEHVTYLSRIFTLALKLYCMPLSNSKRNINIQERRINKAISSAKLLFTRSPDKRPIIGKEI